MTRVWFTADDPFGLWHEGDVAEDLGWESDHPDAPPIRLIEYRGETLALTDPYRRGLIVAILEDL